MPSYYNYTSGDIISIIIFGSFFTLASYGVPLISYFVGIEKVNQKQTSLSNVVITTLVLQVLAVVLAFGMIMTMDIFSNLNDLSTATFSEAIGSFYSVDWSNMDITRIVSYYQEKNLQHSELGVFIIIKIIWITLGLVLFFFPFFLVFLVSSHILRKYNEISNGSYYEILKDYFTLLIGVVMLFIVHVELPNVVINQFVVQNNTKISNKSGDNRVPHLYQKRAGAYIANALTKLGR